MEMETIDRLPQKVRDINSITNAYYIMAESLDMILREMELQFKDMGNGVKHQVKQRHTEMMRLIRLLKTTQEKFIQDYECFNGQWNKYDNLRNDAAYIARIILYISDRTFGDGDGNIDKQIEQYIAGLKEKGVVSKELIEKFRIK